MSPKSAYVVVLAGLLALVVFGFPSLSSADVSVLASDGLGVEPPPVIHLPLITNSQRQVSFAPNALIVKLRAAAPAVNTAGALSPGLVNLPGAVMEPLFPLPAVGAASSAYVSSSGLDRIYYITLQPGTDVSWAVSQASSDPDVEYAEPDYLAQRTVAPDDPRYAEQWALDLLQVEDAWTVVTGNTSAIIAIVDSGIDLSHPDLASQLWLNPGEVAGNGQDDDGNQLVDDVRGWNFVAGTNNIADDNGHGTLAAGIAAAATNNDIGIAGVCPGCRIMTVKVMQSSGFANYSDIAQGITYATQKGARVINLSLGGYADSQLLRDTIADAEAHGVVLVAGAGNGNSSAPFYPAAYDQVLAVAGTTITDTRTSFTNYGSWVDVAAPGADILTTALGGDYLSTSGTSLAAPFGAGLAGLLVSLHPEWTPALVRLQLMQTSTPIDAFNPGYAGQLGRGRLNAAAAVLPPTPQLTYASYSVNGVVNAKTDFNATVNLTVTFANQWADVANVSGILSTTDPFVTIIAGTAAFGTVLSGQSGTNATPFTVNIATGAGYNHPIPFRLALTANGGYQTTIAFTVFTRSSVEPVQGTIAVDTTWTKDKSYLVKNNVGVAPGVTLTIESGTVIKFDGDFSLNVGGTLIADGSVEQPIVFEYNGSGSWNRIHFDEPSVDALADGASSYVSGSLLRHVIIRKASGGVACSNATPYLDHITLIDGDITCALGSTALHLRNSTIGGNVNAYQNDTYAWDVTLEQGGFILDSGSVVNSSITGGGGIQIGSGMVFSPTLVQGNNVTDAPGTGISSTGNATILDNRVVGSQENGIIATEGLVQGNLIANTGGDGLRVGTASVLSNTFTGIGGTALYISGIPVQISGNNFELNHGAYDLYNDNAAPLYTLAQHNWWGTTDNTQISQRIFDFDDDFNKGRVTFTPVLAVPSTQAPAYVRRVTVLPDTTVGIQTATFEIEFSHAMDTLGHPPTVMFVPQTPRWQTYTTDNSGLLSHWINAIAVDAMGNVWFGSGDGAAVLRPDGTWTYASDNSGLPFPSIQAITTDAIGNVWFGTFAGGAAVLRPDGTWNKYSTENSGLPSNFISALTTDATGNVWFGTEDGGVAVLRPDSAWNTYTTDNSELPSNLIRAITTDTTGNVWIGTEGGGASVLHPDGTWNTYTTENSELPSNNIFAITTDASGNVWFGTSDNGAGVLHPDDTWNTYTLSNDGFPPYNFISAIITDASGNVWLGTSGGAGVLRPDGTWNKYSTENSGLPSNFISALTTDASGNVWFGTDGGAAVLHGGLEQFIMDENPAWSDETRFSVNRQITSLVPRNIYSVTVAGAYDSRGMEIAPYSGKTFTVDYAGAIADSTPPSPPAVAAWSNGSLSNVSAAWTAADADSAITQYRYRIGSTPGGAQVVDWTYLSETSFNRSNLNLVSGQTYYVTIAARNEGGLWSEGGVSDGIVAGVNTPKPVPTIFLPNVGR